MSSDDELPELETPTPPTESCPSCDTGELYKIPVRKGNEFYFVKKCTQCRRAHYFGRIPDTAIEEYSSGASSKSPASKHPCTVAQPAPTSLHHAKEDGPGVGRPAPAFTGEVHHLTPLRSDRHIKKSLIQGKGRNLDKCEAAKRIVKSAKKFKQDLH